jgi:hypothetical protein
MSDIKGVEFHDLLGLSQPLTKLFETVSSAIGKWYEPVGVERLAKAKAYELQIVSEAINRNTSFPVEYSDGRITISSSDFEELAKRTGYRLYYQELRKQQNFEAIVEVAGTELEKKKQFQTSLSIRTGR